MVEWRTRLSGWIPEYPDEQIERGILVLEELLRKYEGRYANRNRKKYEEGGWNSDNSLKRIRHLSTYITKAQEKSSASYNEILDVLRCYGASIDDLKMAVEWELHASEDRGVPKGVVFYRYTPRKKKASPAAATEAKRPEEKEPVTEEKKPAEIAEPVDIKEATEKPIQDGDIESWYKKAYGFSYSEVIDRYNAFIAKGKYVEEAFGMAINKSKVQWNWAKGTSRKIKQ